MAVKRTNLNHIVNQFLFAVFYALTVKRERSKNNFHTDIRMFTSKRRRKISSSCYYVRGCHYDQAYSLAT